MEKQYLIDSHVHTNHSFDSNTSMTKYCQRAIQLGLKKITFTNHLDFDPEDISYGYYDYEKIQKDISQVQAQFPTLKVLHGVEITYQTECHKVIQEFLQNHDFDYVIGSVHILDFDNKKFFITLPGVRKAYLNYSMTGFIRLYYILMEKLITSSLFDVIGHFDVLRRYVPPTWDNIREESSEFARKCLKKAINCNIGLEVNCSGFRHGLGEPYPARELLMDYFNLGGKDITLGSDAHSASHLANFFEEGTQIIRKIGFKKLIYFSERKKIDIEL
ncbi:MAG: histidinol-phosphatase HisJ family protein [Promethearchaeota archaeon]